MDNQVENLFNLVESGMSELLLQYDKPNVHHYRSEWGKRKEKGERESREPSLHSWHKSLSEDLATPSQFVKPGGADISVQVF
jgi:hypothetical protein